MTEENKTYTEREAYDLAARYVLAVNSYNGLYSRGSYDNRLTAFEGDRDYNIAVEKSGCLFRGIVVINISHV